MGNLINSMPSINKLISNISNAKKRVNFVIIVKDS